MVYSTGNFSSKNKKSIIKILVAFLETDHILIIKIKHIMLYIEPNCLWVSLEQTVVLCGHKKALGRGKWIAFEWLKMSAVYDLQ